MQALLELDCIPSGMELFQAADEDSWSLIQNVIDDCDYYLVVLAGRYGSVHPDTGISYTEMEYRYALENNIPTMAFLHEDVSKLESGVVDSGDGLEKLLEFRGLCERKQVKFWNGPADLGSVVSRSLIRLTKERPATGWVKADTLASDEAREQVLQMKEEIEALKSELSEAKSAYQGDISDLAQGSDLIEVKWIGSYRDPEATWNSHTAKFRIDGKISLDSVFRIISPAMVDEISEHDFKTRINLAFQNEFTDNLINFNYRKDDKSEEEEVESSLNNIQATDDAFQKIKVQLMALNLIERGIKKRPPSDKLNYWKITDEGERKMMTLIAIKKDEIGMSA